MRLKDFDFRIWNEQESKFCYKMDENLQLGIMSYCGDKRLPKYKWEYSAFYKNEALAVNSGNDLKIELWSGFKDINNKNIYEGDICILNRKKDSYYCVDFLDSAFILIGVEQIQEKRRDYFLTLQEINNSAYRNSPLAREGHILQNLEKIEVIGNIHENPELLNKRVWNEVLKEN